MGALMAFYYIPSTQQQLFYDPLSNTTLVSRYQKKRSPTHLSWSSIIPYLLPPSFMIHGIFLVQFTCLTVFFHNLSPSFLWSTSWPGTLHFILHTFLHLIIVFFLQHMSISSQPILLYTKIMSSIPILSQFYFLMDTIKNSI